MPAYVPLKAISLWCLRWNTNIHTHVDFKSLNIAHGLSISLPDGSAFRAFVSGGLFDFANSEYSTKDFQGDSNELFGVPSIFCLNTQ